MGTNWFQITPKLKDQNIRKRNRNIENIRIFIGVLENNWRRQTGRSWCEEEGGGRKVFGRKWKRLMKKDHVWRVGDQKAGTVEKKIFLENNI